MSPRAWFAVEVAAIAAVAIAPVPVPAGWLPAIASVSLWARGRSWFLSAPTPPDLVPIGVACGAVALVLSLALSAPVGALTGRAVEWTQYTIVRGSPAAFLAVATIVAAQAVAIEMSLRGWLVPRVLELIDGPDAAMPSRGEPSRGVPDPLAPAAPNPSRRAAALAILTSAVAEAVVTPGHLASRAGAFTLGLGGAILFLGAGRRLAAPLACRLTFELGAVLLAALRVV